jgi:hypothetical protein
MDELITELLAIRGVRYVAIYLNAQLVTRAHSQLPGASSSESDRYEELIVNPTLLTLLHQRGNIDCGGFHFVLIRYGHFFQFIQPLPSGHVSVAIEPSIDPLALIQDLQRRIRAHCSNDPALQSVGSPRASESTA